MKLPAKILIWGVVLLAPAAAFAQRGGGARSRGELRIGNARGAVNRGGVRDGSIVVGVGVPFYYDPIPFGAYPYTSYPYGTYIPPSTLPTYSLNPTAVFAPAAAPVPVPPPPASDSVQALASQVQELTAEVQRLRTQQAPPQIAAAPEPVPAPRDTTLVFRDNHRMSVQSYAIIEQTLRVLDKDNPARIALADLDLEATRRVNQENGIRFAMPSAQ